MAKARPVTPAQIEERYKAIRSCGVDAFTDVRAARNVANQVWRRHGFAGFTELLSAPGNIEKLTKTRGRVLVGLALSPADSSGIAELCPFAGLCRDACVAFSGSGRYSSTQRSRAARTDLFVNHPAAFVTLLLHELGKYAAKYRGRLGVRLNTYSDVRWERILPRGFFDTFARVAFYDYTKHPLRSRPADTLPANYVLTYSYSERDTPEKAAAMINAGRNVAAVVSVRGGEINGRLRPIPRELFGFPVIDGDKKDDRYRDRRGVVVALRRKHTLAASSPFVVAVTA